MLEEFGPACHRPGGAGPGCGPVCEHVTSDPMRQYWGECPWRAIEGDVQFQLALQVWNALDAGSVSGWPHMWAAWVHSAVGCIRNAVATKQDRETAAARKG